MTQERITALASEFLKVITNAEGISLLRAEYHANGAIAGVYFLEYSDDEIPSDLMQFQEEYISSDYYNHPGYLQWNYYLIFIRPPGFISKELKGIIEKDDVYTRKFVFTPDEAKAYFTYTYSNQTVETDVISKWKEKLRAVDLDEVYTDNYYTEAIPRFLNDNVEKENTADQNIGTIQHSDLNINRVSSIYLRDNYRTHPQPDRSFNFKTVNLIWGTNGSGKTSLLTSIELVVAGKTISDPSSPEPDNCIGATYNDVSDSVDEYTPNDNSKYRLRDTSWYSSSYQTGNELYRTFNRYNYFDSDAAYKLAFDEDKRHLTKYLSAIALGPEFGRIQDRMRGFDNRLAAEARAREKTIEAQKSRIEDARKIEQAIAIATDPLALFKVFTSTAIEIGWRSTIPNTLTDDTTGYEKAIQDSGAVVGALEKLLQDVKLRSLIAAKDMLNKNETILLQLTESKLAYIKAKEKADTSGRSVELVNAQLEILNRAKIYFDNPDSFSLSSLDENLSILEERITRNQKIANAFLLVEKKQLFQSSEKFGIAKERFETDRGLALQEQKAAVEQKETLKQTLDELKTVVSEIKALGMKFLSLEDEAKACPLCETPYSKDQLIGRIKSIDLVSSENATLKILNDQILRSEQIVLKNVAAMAELDEIEQVITLLSPSDIYRNQTFIEIYQSLQNAKTALQADIERKEALTSKKLILAQKGITKEGMVIFKKEFELAFPDLPFYLDSHTSYDELFSQQTKALPVLELQYKLDREDEQDKKIPVDQILKALEIPVTESDPERHLQYLNETLNKIIEQFSVLYSFLTFEDDDELIDIKTRVTKLHSSFQSYRKSLADQSQLNAARESILSAQHQIDELQPIVEKIKKALSVLHEILTTDNEEKILGEFLKANEKDIQNIFLTLHSPKEFSRIEFNYDEKNVSLYKLDSDRAVSLNRISTGQRSALALSIFLALHKKVDKGPKILLFDDPVTYVDDLNILSFLDYLRELVIKENRQLFFATANQKLAGLFEKKFAFLGDQSQTLTLKRMD